MCNPVLTVLVKDLTNSHSYPVKRTYHKPESNTRGRGGGGGRGRARGGGRGRRGRGRGRGRGKSDNEDTESYGRPRQETNLADYLKF